MLDNLLSERYTIDVIRLDKRLNSKPVAAYIFEIRATPLKSNGPDWEGSIALMRTTNGRWHGAKWHSYAKEICKKEKIYDLEGIKKTLEECRATHHLNLKKKYPYLNI